MRHSKKQNPMHIWKCIGFVSLCRWGASKRYCWGFNIIG